MMNKETETVDHVSL